MGIGFLYRVLGKEKGMVEVGLFIYYFVVCFAFGIYVGRASMYKGED